VNPSGNFGFPWEDFVEIAMGAFDTSSALTAEDADLRTSS